ncbi:hypothetical protein D9M73_240650 [compost metagenome]
MLRLDNPVERLHVKYLQSLRLHYRQESKHSKQAIYLAQEGSVALFPPFLNISKPDNLTKPKMLEESRFLKNQIGREYQWEPFDLTLLIIDEISNNNKITPMTKEIHEI